MDIGLTNAVGFSANSILINAVAENNKEAAVTEIKSINNLYKTNTNFKGIKIHLHTEDTKSFLRSWEIEQNKDNLSSFRHTLKKLKSNHKSNVEFELGRAGVFIRALMPLKKVSICKSYSHKDIFSIINFL